LAVIIIAIVACSIGTGALLLGQNNQAPASVQDNAISNPSSSPNPLINSTINAINSTIIAGENTTIVNPVTPTPIITPTPMTPTPPPFSAIYTVSERTFTETKTLFTITITVQSGNGMELNPSNFILVGQNDLGDVAMGADITGEKIQAFAGTQQALNISIGGHNERTFTLRYAWNFNNNIVYLTPA